MLKYSEAISPPRTLFLRWPLGHPMGEVGFKAQQTFILKRALNLIGSATEKGVIERPKYRWRRHEDMKIP